jgi:predicted ArsR family transcriptional regulator
MNPTGRIATLTIPAGRAQRLRDTVMAVLELHGPSTADQVASLLSQSVLSIRPRVAELHKMGLIVATGERRRNRSGHSAMTWRIA